MPTIFFSHSSRDDAMASAVVDWLRARGFDDIFVDFDSIRAGDKWTETLRRASGSCRVVLCLVTPEWLASSECFGEFTAGWYAGRRLIPLICVPDAKLDDTQEKRLSRVLLEDQGVDISRVGAPLALDLEGHPEVTTPLIEGLRAAGAVAKVGLDPLVFAVDDRRDSEGNLLKPPFPGLESFGDSDADAAIFYGRSPEIVQVLEDLREFRAGGDRRAYAHAGRAYVIQGASGSGKSSLLKAGVLPRLRRERGWLALRSFRPGADPLLHFAEALAKPIEEGRTTYQAQGTIRDRLLEVWRTALEDVLRVSVTGVSIDEGPFYAALRGTDHRFRGDGIGFVLSPGYRSVVVGDQEYSFTDKQALAVEALDKARRSGNRRLHQAEIQGAANTSQRVGQLFAENPASGALIKNDGLGYYWLDL